jgi:glycosyltransferase involved in cell wall biosynthesis
VGDDVTSSGEGKAGPTLRASVVICNFNYAAFVGAAIESALALDWPQVEVVVVDDGSSDGSREIIERYRDRVTVVYQRNAGQREACNAAFARCHGEVVIFLDSDDLLHPSVLKEIAAVWRPGISKVQFQMAVIDGSGRPIGALLPQYHVVPTPELIRAWVAASGTYPTPPGSGNAYARAFLEKIFPLSGDDRAADSYCIAAAPFFGDVLTVAKPLVSYRVHGRNAGAMLTLDEGRFAAEVTRALRRAAYANSIARERGLWSSEIGTERNLAVLPYRLASLRLTPESHPIPEDSMPKVLRDLAAACSVPQGRSVKERAALLTWALGVAVAPRGASARIILWRFSAASRPVFLKKLLSRLRVVKATPQAPEPA